jgi:hypothetical protein
VNKNSLQKKMGSVRSTCFLTILLFLFASSFCEETHDHIDLPTSDDLNVAIDPNNYKAIYTLQRKLHFLNL